MAEAYETAEVVAPSNLEGGYHLEVDVNGVTRTVIVVRGLESKHELSCHFHPPSE